MNFQRSKEYLEQRKWSFFNWKGIFGWNILRGPLSVERRRWRTVDQVYRARGALRWRTGLMDHSQYARGPMVSNSAHVDRVCGSTESDGWTRSTRVGDRQPGPHVGDIEQRTGCTVGRERWVPQVSDPTIKRKFD
uniref:Uncharacterized protein n=1 Tax=Oryza sativa subsp. japonica TaxID=39947 RepID=Q69Y73_ORYSJ|nr:hypothetical protein [Oryza sativa Japonica Group]BAD37645.1 hypothetical protein [Oryza sativa Japonica Group]